MKTPRFLKTIKDLAVPLSRRTEAQSGPDSICDECKKIDFRSLSRLDVNVLRRHDITIGWGIGCALCRFFRDAIREKMSLVRKSSFEHTLSFTRITYSNMRVTLRLLCNRSKIWFIFMSWIPTDFLAVSISRARISRSSYRTRPSIRIISSCRRYCLEC